MKYLGYVVIGVGLFLFLGNVFNFFHTFPLAGWLTIMAGLWIARRK